MSIRLKINLVLLIIGVLTSVFIAGFNYYEARNRVFTEAQNKAELISSFAMASREYTKKTMRPLAQKIVGKDKYHPELMGGFFVTRAIADIFSKSQEGYSFKQATLNPIRPTNKADAQETSIIETFKTDRELKLSKGTLTKKGKETFYVARPVINKKGCLRCHGKKESAPKDQLEKYTGDGGYDWQLNDVVATFITYVPIDHALKELQSIAAKTILAGLVSIAVIMLSVSFFMNRFVVKPITELTRIADDISQGKGLDQVVKSNTNDEIGALSDSFNKMRLSVVKLIQMIRAKK